MHSHAGAVGTRKTLERRGMHSHAGAVGTRKAHQSDHSPDPLY